MSVPPARHHEISGPNAEQLARGHVARVLSADGWTVPERLLLCMRELVDYAHRHWHGQLSILVTFPAPGVGRVTVCDDTPLRRLRSLRPRSDDHSIQTLNQLSAAWGLGPLGTGVGLWTEAYLTRDAHPDQLADPP